MKKKIKKGGLSTTEILSKSVSIPSAQANKVCNPDDDNLYDFEWCKTIYHKMKFESRVLAELFAFQYETGCRISECLSIKYYDVLADGRVIIRGLKGSNDRVVSCSIGKSYLLHCRLYNSWVFSNFNRFYVYRFYKKYGVMFVSKKSKKKSVTHALRHINALNMRKAGLKSSDVSEFLGHKNLKNGKYYGNEE